MNKAKTKSKGERKEERRLEFDGSHSKLVHQEREEEFVA